MEKLFQLKANKTNVKTEFLAGVTTFLAMAYILAVNPGILSAYGTNGMDQNALFTATAIAAAIGTLCMAFIANYPIALASGMGLNAAFAIIVAGGVSWQIALTAVLLEGLVFIFLSIFKFRERIINAIPHNLKLAITVGIGLFIAVIGMKSAGMYISYDGTTLLENNLLAPQVVLCFVGIIAIAIMLKKQVKGAILWGILGVWILGIGAQLIGWYVVDFDNSAFPLIPDWSKIVSLPPSIAPIFFKFDFSGAWKLGIDFLVIAFTFLMVDMFDTVGTLIGVAKQANLLDKDDKLPRAGKALLSDAIGTTAGSVLGVSTVTSYIESSAGVAEGGRTGLTSVFTGLLFIAALFFSEIFLTIPAFATAAALIVVGALMMSAAKEIDWKDISVAVPCLFTIIFMPITSSIANGILIGFLAHTLIMLFTGKAKDVHIIIYLMDALFILKLIIPVLQG